MSKKISEAGLKLIKSFEGCRLTAYKPVPTEQYWTIGWGHYGPDVKQGATITQAQADAMLVVDLAKYEAYVNNPAYVPITDKLTQSQFDALVSFCYNCGAGNLKSLCKGRTAAQIVEHIPAYNKGGGNVLAGLVRRRQAEVDLFNTKNKKDDEPMTAAEKAAFDKLQAEVAAQKAQLERFTEAKPAPAWFVKEFGSGDLGGVISSPEGTDEFWRALAVMLRVSKRPIQ